MKKCVSVYDFGAYGDGFHDDFAPIQKALDSGAEEVIIPIGAYNISSTLKVKSNTKITADRCAHLFLRGSKRKQRGDFLLSNENTNGYNENIELSGGIWDGCCQDAENDKPHLFDTNGYSGSVLNFCGVKNLKISNIVVKNSTTFFVRLARIEDFVIENVDLSSDEFAYNQDGLHFGGDVKRGLIKNIRALTCGQTNDDMIALNADDCVERVENLDLPRSVIEDLIFENIYAENCYTVIRMLSVTAPIRNIKFKNIHAGYRNYVINGDGARYCRTPLFKEEEYPVGVGRVSNFSIENLFVHPVTAAVANKKGSAYNNPEFAIRLECLCKDFKIKNFRFYNDNPKFNALLVANVTDTTVIADGNTTKLKTKSDKLLLSNFKELTINSEKEI